MEKYFLSHVNQKVNSVGVEGPKGAVGTSKEAAEKYLWHQGEQTMMSMKGNHGYEFQGITAVSTQLIPTDVG